MTSTHHAKLRQLLPARPALLVLDFDGVLTDNFVYVDQHGVESVRCSKEDGMGLSLVRKAGLEVVILSSEENPVVADHQGRRSGSSHRRGGALVRELPEDRAVPRVEPGDVGAADDDDLLLAGERRDDRRLRVGRLLELLPAQGAADGVESGDPPGLASDPDGRLEQKPEPIEPELKVQIACLRKWAPRARHSADEAPGRCA